MAFGCLPLSNKPYLGPLLLLLALVLAMDVGMEATLVTGSEASRKAFVSASLVLQLRAYLPSEHAIMVGDGCGLGEGRLPLAFGSGVLSSFFC